ncbi:MAG: cytidylate kinase family protein [Candidatus Moranbacteria bacterium]|jgi:cytidylate kinase|nr:cytidylate kinase family protein [Candidatus Moranbacteria bacterium]
MIISFSGDIGSGKSTIAEKISEKIGYERFYMGQILRNIAKERKLTLIELLKRGESDPSIDKQIDDFIVKLSKENDNFIIESRTAWYFIPHSLKIYLKVSEQEGAKRIFDQLQNKNERNEDRKLLTLEDVIRSNRNRRETDDKRYRAYYGIDISKMENYDFVLDTTNLSIDDVYDKTLAFIKNQIK